MHSFNLLTRCSYSPFARRLKTHQNQNAIEYSHDNDNVRYSGCIAIQQRRRRYRCPNLEQATRGQCRCDAGCPPRRDNGKRRVARQGRQEKPAHWQRKASSHGDQILFLLPSCAQEREASDCPPSGAPSTVNEAKRKVRRTTLLLSTR
jgi:hypothetical protein